MKAEQSFVIQFEARRADETANAGDLENYILADGGPFDVKPPRDTLSLRPKWKNLTT